MFQPTARWGMGSSHKVIELELTAEERESIEMFRIKYRFRSKSEAVKMLVKIGMRKSTALPPKFVSKRAGVSKSSC